MANVLLFIFLQVISSVIVFFIIKASMEKRFKVSSVIAKLQEELNSIMVELNQATEKNIELIEDKIHGLSELLEAADKKIVVLKRETEKLEVSKNVYNQIQKNKSPVMNPPLPSVAGLTKPVNEGLGRQEQVIKLYKEGFSKDVIANHMGITVGEVELIISVMESKI